MKLLIHSCTDGMLWYSNMIGQTVPYVRTIAHEGIYISKEPAGYTNIVHMKDAKIVNDESTETHS